jgi:exopolyphosphatase/guanosine-5'-triphosphate,3'-diphosphate pyrophosphatase
VDSVSRLTVDGLVQKYSIPYPDAETLVPALLTYLHLLKETQAKDLIISDASIRAGILQDLVPAEQGTRLKKLSIQILSAARSLGRKYHCDENHAERVRELSVRLFNELKTEQRMTETHWLYLEVAALLHDIGLFVSSRSHLPFASNCRIGPFRIAEAGLEVANISRYHRRALPQRSHLSYLA